MIEKLLKDNEEWLMHRILHYAKKMNYTKYTSTLAEAWRISIQGLSEMIIKDLNEHTSFDMYADEVLTSHMAEFGQLEAKKHRERGVSLDLFFSLSKYYRDAYQDLLNEHSDLITLQMFRNITHLFDFFETAYILEWTNLSQDKHLLELEKSNRLMTNEKNLYLTIFESTPMPMILIGTDKKIKNLNMAAVRLFAFPLKSGMVYYHKDLEDAHLEDLKSYDQVENIDLEEQYGINITAFIASTQVTEQKGHFTLPNTPKIIRYQMMKMLDVSGKFSGIVIIII